MGLVGCGPFGVVDYKHFSRCFRRFQFQAELFLEGCEERWACPADWNLGRGVIGQPFQVDINAIR